MDTKYSIEYGKNCSFSNYIQRMLKQKRSTRRRGKASSTPLYTNSDHHISADEQSELCVFEDDTPEIIDIGKSS